MVRHTSNSTDQNRLSVLSVTVTRFTVLAGDRTDTMTAIDCLDTDCNGRIIHLEDDKLHPGPLKPYECDQCHGLWVYHTTQDEWLKSPW